LKLYLAFLFVSTNDTTQRNEFQSRSTLRQRLNTSGYYALGIPVYVIVVLAELRLNRRRGLKAYGFSDSVVKPSAYLGKVMLGLFLGPILIALYDFAYENYTLLHWSKNSLTSWLVGFTWGLLQRRFFGKG
jgi:alkylglycerol monooxygenase